MTSFYNRGYKIYQLRALTVCVKQHDVRLRFVTSMTGKLDRGLNLELLWNRLSSSRLLKWNVAMLSNHQLAQAMYRACLPVVSIFVCILKNNLLMLRSRYRKFLIERTLGFCGTSGYGGSPGADCEWRVIAHGSFSVPALLMPLPYQCRGSNMINDFFCCLL